MAGSVALARRDDRRWGAAVRARAGAKPDRAGGAHIPALLGNPRLMRQEDVLNLQQRAGNQAVQRLLTGGQPVIQRKLAFADTDWTKTQFLDASSGGGGGVLFAGEQGREVVVKPGESMATEGALAALLLNQVAGKSGLGLAPGFRLVSPQEAKQIKAAFDPLVSGVGGSAPDVKGTGGRQFKNDRAQKLVGMLDKPGVVVQDMAQGKELESAIKEVPKHTKKKLFGLGGRKLRKTSPLRIFKDPRAIHALGSATAVDLFTGNKDRLFQFNPENLLVSPYSMSMIDNVWMGTEASYFQTTQVEGRGGKMYTITADEGLKGWRSDPLTQQLAHGNWLGVANKAWAAVLQNAALGARNVDQNSWEKLMKPYSTRFISTFCQGLIDGKRQLVISLGHLLANPSALQKLAPGVDLTEIMATIRKRRDFLQGG